MPELVSVSVVVPVFNSEATLDRLCARIAAALGPAAARHWEIVLVNDGSADASWDTIVALARAHKEVRGLDLARNFGQHNALLAGLHAARNEVIVTIDDDLQDRPEEIPHLLEALGPGVDLVYGKPVVKRRVLPRRVATRIVRAVLVARLGSVSLDIGGFRAFRTSVLDSVPADQGRWLAIDTLLVRAAHGHATVSVEHDPRARGRSNYTFRKLVGHALAEFRSVGLPPGRRGHGDLTYVVNRTTMSR